MPASDAPAIPAVASGADEGIRDFFDRRAGDVDAGRASIRDGIAFLAHHGLADAGIADSAALIADIARCDMASAFSTWAHRMVLLYLTLAPPDSPLRDLLPDVRAGRIVGATAMASGTARYLTGAPIPVTFGRRGDDYVLAGRIPWASNLLPPFLGVTAAVDRDDPDRVLVVAFSDRTDGVTVAPYPDLLALGATGSSSIILSGAVVSPDAIVSASLAGFVERILAPFLLLQSSFCRGLAERALDEAAAGIGPTSEILRAEVERLRADADRAGRRLDRFARRVDRHATPAGGTGPDPLPVPLRDLLRLRLRWATLAGAAVRTELAILGGRGYLRSGGTARRLREAAFLPIQAPTEVQLRWMLSRSA